MSVVKYTNNNLKKIINVYQLQYKNGLAQGFGDFVNGSFFLLQLCIKFNLIFDIDISKHPISKYFVFNKNINENEPILYDDILYFQVPHELRLRTNNDKLYNYFINNLNNINTKNYYLFCNLDPIYSIQDIGRNIIQSKLAPTLEITTAIDNILNNFNIKPNTFEIIHIRTGDKYLLNNSNILTDYDKNAYINLLSRITNNETKYIIISDNMVLKNVLKYNKKYNIVNFDICHTGEDSYKSDEGLKNTVIDFFLMSKSRKITSIALKSRGGTGFSQVCSKLFNIPYKSLLIDLGDHAK
jgi:hypothetical protein